jgi:hypothetical protein
MWEKLEPCCVERCHMGLNLACMASNVDKKHLETPRVES